MTSLEKSQPRSDVAHSQLNLLGVLSELKGVNFEKPCDAASFASLIDSANTNWSKQLAECTTKIYETPKLAKSEKETALFAFVEEAAKLQNGNSIELQRNGSKTIGYQIYPNYAKQAAEQRDTKASIEPEVNKTASEEDPTKVKEELQRAYPPSKAELDYAREIREESARTKAELERANPPTQGESEYAREIREEAAKTRKELEAESKKQ